MLPTARLARRLLVTGLTLAALAIPTSAQAGVLVSSAQSCDDQSLSQVFLPWADVANYTLNPGGDFESGPAWDLSGGATVVDGNELFHVGSDNDSNSLGMPAGSGATSAAICVGIEHPTIRFFARSSNPLARLSVEVLFEDAFGNVHSAPVGVVASGSGWAPTPIYPIVANLLALLPGERTAVQFRFRASGGSFQIDDVYVDPYNRR